MQLVVDANILVAELLRKRGRALIADTRLELFIAEKAMEEALHELKKRVDYIAKKSDTSEKQLEKFLDLAIETANTNFYVVKTEQYRVFKKEALLRIPQDADDWHTVALALMLNADIWTQDKDFLGCGVATWITETLRLKLGAF